MSFNNNSTIDSSAPSRGPESPNNDSPTSTLQSPPASGLRLDGSTNYRPAFSTGTPGHARPQVVRSDPSLLTCFDPADKELYDLWAPKR